MISKNMLKYCDKPWSDKVKQKMSEAHKGKHWRLENGKRIYY